VTSSPEADASLFSLLRGLVELALAFVEEGTGAGESLMDALKVAKYRGCLMPSWINLGKVIKPGESTAVGGLRVADLGRCVSRVSLS